MALKEFFYFHIEMDIDYTEKVFEFETNNDDATNANNYKSIKSKG